MEFLNRHSRIFRPIELVTVAVCLLTTAFCIFDKLDDVQNTQMMLSMAFNFIATSDALIVVAALSLDKRRALHNDLQMFIFCIASILLLIDTLTGYLEGNADLARWNYALYAALNLLFLIVAALYIKYLFSSLILPHNKVKPYYKATNILFAIGFVLWVLNFFNGMLFDVDSGGHVIRGAYDYVFLFFPIMIGSLTILGVFVYSSDKRERIVAAIMIFVIWLFYFVEILAKDLSPIYLTPILVLMINFSNNYVYRSEIISHKEAQILKKNAELEDLKFHSMVSQVQPHFLYNALTSIMNIQGNPPETKDAITDFAAYLRGNLSTINTPNPIPFSKELDHIETYLNLEKLRFKDKLEIDWHIHDTRFAIPALTAQTMVENAVKHGVTKKENGGKIIIVSEPVEGGHMVKIIDNGVGFDVKAVPNDGQVHVGIVSARKRLKAMSNGTLTIKSTPGVGTTVQIFIPESQ